MTLLLFLFKITILMMLTLCMYLILRFAHIPKSQQVLLILFAWLIYFHKYFFDFPFMTYSYVLVILLGIGFILYLLWEMIHHHTFRNFFLNSIFIIILFLLPVIGHTRQYYLYQSLFHYQSEYILTHGVTNPWFDYFTSVPYQIIHDNVYYAIGNLNFKSLDGIVITKEDTMPVGDIERYTYYEKIDDYCYYFNIDL